MAFKTPKDYGNALRCFDNGGKSLDRFTIVPPRWDKQNKISYGKWQCIAASEHPFHPQGFGNHFEGYAHSQLGKRVRLDSLPIDVQKFARQSFPEYFQIV